MTTASLPYRKDIDALRGISILLVVIFHAFPNVLPGGFIGVDVFFVLSGYLISRIILNDCQHTQFSIRLFYIRRIMRLLPALIFVLITCLIVGWLILFPSEYKQLGFHLLSTASFLQNFNLIGELGYFDDASYTKPLLHLWTLSIEEQFYVFWPLLLAAVFKTKLNLLFVMTLIIASSFTANILFVADYPNEVFYHSFSRFWQLSIGALIAVIEINKQNLRTRPQTTYLAYIGLAAILLSSIYLHQRKLYPYWYALAPTVGAALIIFSGLKIKRTFGLVYFGKISYSLYLWHWPTLSFFAIYLGKNTLFSTLIAISLSIALAHFSYRYIEVIRYKQAPSIPRILLYILATIGFIGFLIHYTQGVEGRSHLEHSSKNHQQFMQHASKDEACLTHVRNLLKEEALFDYCRSNISSSNKPLIALIGDSHAHALFPGFANLAESKGYNLLAFANISCPPFEGYLWGNNPNDLDLCPKKIEQILQLIEKEKSIQKVIISTRGPVYIHGKTIGRHTEKSVAASLNHFISKERLNYGTLQRGFAKTLQRLSSRDTVQTFYIAENPELDFWPKSTLSRPFDFAGWSSGTHRISKNLYTIRMERYLASIKGAMSAFPTATFVDVTDIFCPTDSCLYKHQGTLLYRDDDHLSEFGSHFLAKKLNPAIFSNR